MTNKHLCETDPFCFTCPQCEDEAQTGIHTFPPAKETAAETLAVLAEDLGASVDELLDYAVESVGAPQPWKDFVPEEHHFVRASDYGGWQVKDGPSPMQALRKASLLPDTYFDKSPITDESVMLYVAARLRAYNKGYVPDEEWSAQGCTKCLYLEGVFQEYCPWHKKLQEMQEQIDDAEQALASEGEVSENRLRLMREAQAEAAQQKKDWHQTYMKLAAMERTLEEVTKQLSLAQARAEKAEKALELLQTKFTNPEAVTDCDTCEGSGERRNDWGEKIDCVCITGPALTWDEHLAKIKAEVDTWPEWKKVAFVDKPDVDWGPQTMVISHTEIQSPTVVTTVEDNYVFCQCDQYQRDDGHDEHCPFGVPRI